ncbi:MAG TPA: NfeD family protein [Pyrinomonadaceae bacterium]|jgi:membrane protein implicated in regulation of membrane protease activity|nr:NfeD family protein [Pyrinomonadaceae bacterium]
MDSITWILWTILGVVLIVAEVFTPGFVLLWFGVGALAAALSSFLGAGLAGQFLVFILLSTALTALSRTIFANYFTRRDEPAGFKTGAATLPGKVGTVVTSSRGALNEGAVKVFGSTWTAYPAEGEPPLEAGDRVVVERLSGASIYVRRVDSLPDWRGSELTESNDKR